MKRWIRPTEQQVLAASVVVTVILAVVGIGFGLFTRSQSIVFDGIFSIVDFLMSALVLFVARLLKRSGSRRFQYGYWHFEPLVSAFRGLALLAVCIYALVDGIGGVLAGGYLVELGEASVYAAVVSGICFALYFYERWVNRRIGSEFIRIDMNSCLMSAAITLALFLGFLSAELLERAGFGALKPYADPVILIVMTLVLLPIPAGIIYRSMQEVFMVAPPDVVQVVNNVMNRETARHGFSDYKAYVAKSGRIHLIDIVILLPERCPKTTVELDAIREEIAGQLSDFAKLEQWLTISFTTRRDWL